MLLDERVIGNLRAGRVVLRVLRVLRCHACMPDALTRITFFLTCNSFTSFSDLILPNHDE
jgi:hypothetical protein